MFAKPSVRVIPENSKEAPVRNEAARLLLEESVETLHSSASGLISAAVDAGIMGYEMYIQGQQFYGGDGIVTHGVENTIRNVGQLAKEGMCETDKEIIRIMVERG